MDKSLLLILGATATGAVFGLYKWISKWEENHFRENVKDSRLLEYTGLSETGVNEARVKLLLRETGGPFGNGQFAFHGTYSELFSKEWRGFLRNYSEKGWEEAFRELVGNERVVKYIRL